MIRAICTVKVYDSLYSDSSEYDDLQAQLDYLYSAAAGDDGVKFEVCQPQSQRGTEDYGLLAVANALATAIGQEPEKTLLDHETMRQYLIQCLQDHVISPFPRRRMTTDSDSIPTSTESRHATSLSNTGEKHSKVSSLHCVHFHAQFHAV